MQLLQPLRSCWVKCVIYHERDVCEEQHHTYMWREQAIIEWSWHVNYIVACYHSAKLCAYAARDFRSQHNCETSDRPKCFTEKKKQISPRGPYKPHCFYPRVRSLRRRACFLLSASSQESHIKNLNIAPDACSLKLWLTRWLAAHEQWLRRRCNKLDTAVVTIIVPWPPAKTCEITTIFQNFYLHFVHRTLYYNQNDVTCQCGDSPHITLNS